MSSIRVSKHLERIALAVKIERFGEEMSPCSNCVRRKRRCIVSSSQATRCSECVRGGRANCNYSSRLPSLSDWENIDKQRRRLQAEEEEAMAKILRLRQQQRYLDDREKEMVKRGLSSLDELDRAEEEEKEKIAAEEASAKALSEASDFLADPTLDPQAFLDLPDSFWANIASSSPAPVDPPDPRSIASG